LAPRRPFALALALAALALGACSDWRAKVDPARAREEPLQEPLEAPPIEYERKGHRIRLATRASYRLTAYAVETSRQILDEWDFAVPMDLSVVWGPVADPAVLKHMKFHLSRRYVSWFADRDPGVPRPVIESHVANVHLVPADEEVASALGRIEVGDLVTLAGRLVDIEIRDGAGAVKASMRTSLRRDDVGSGACENLWVERVEIERP
jgi:hypothetical protein